MAQRGGGCTGKHTDPPAQPGWRDRLDTEMLAELGLPPAPLNYRHSLGVARHPLGQLGAPAHAGGCALCPPAAPGVPVPPETHQLDAGGVAVPALGALLQHVGGSRLQRQHRARGWRDPLRPPHGTGAVLSASVPILHACPGLHPPARHPLPPTPLPQPILTGGRLTSQYACSWQSMTMRSPFRRCLAALPVQRQRGGAGTLPAPAAPSGAASLVAPPGWGGAVPALTGAAPAPASPRSPTCG